MSTSEAKVPKPVTFIGPLPPPVTGMTFITQIVVDELERAGPVRCFNWSRQKYLKGMRWKIARVRGAIRSCAGLIARGLQPGEILYCPANSSWGMAYDVAILGLGRLLGYRIVLHHHVYSYVDRYDWRMALVTRIVGSNGAHVVYCEKMREDFLGQYSTDAEFLFVPPTIVSSKEIVGSPRESPSERAFTLGFLSNLIIAKGLPEVLQTFERLKSEGCDVRLVVAGPCQEAAVQKMLDSLVARWGPTVEYRGPVYNGEKQRFYQDIDAFLFPTRYENESWGIVLTEALTAGCPVIAYDRGCIPYIVRNGCGLVIPRDEDYVGPATCQLREWMENSISYAAASAQAVQRIHELNKEAAEQLPEFVRQVRSWETQ